MLIDHSPAGPEEAKIFLKCKKKTLVNYFHSSQSDSWDGTVVIVRVIFVYTAKCKADISNQLIQHTCFILMIHRALCLVDPSPVLGSHLVNICGDGWKRKLLWHEAFYWFHRGTAWSLYWRSMGIHESLIWNCAQHYIMLLNEIICFRELSVKVFL